MPGPASGLACGFHWRCSAGLIQMPTRLAHAVQRVTMALARRVHIAHLEATPAKLITGAHCQLGTFHTLKGSCSLLKTRERRKHEICPSLLTLATQRATRPTKTGHCLTTSNGLAETGNCDCEHEHLHPDQRKTQRGISESRTGILYNHI
jgi:hypothetical protein